MWREPLKRFCRVAEQNAFFINPQHIYVNTILINRNYTSENCLTAIDLRPCWFNLPTETVFISLSEPSVCSMNPGGCSIDQPPPPPPPIPHLLSKAFLNAPWSPWRLNYEGCSATFLRRISQLFTENPKQLIHRWKYCFSVCGGNN